MSMVFNSSPLYAVYMDLKYTTRIYWGDFSFRLIDLKWLRHLQ